MNILDNIHLPDLGKKIQELGDRLTSGNWFDKDYLPVPNDVQRFIDNPKEAWKSSAQVQTILSKLQAETGNTTFAKDTLSPIIEVASSNPDIIRYSSLQLLQTGHSANRAFNSKLYPTVDTIENKVQELIGRLIFGGNEQKLYAKTIKGFNGVLKVPTVASELGITGFTSKLVPVTEPTLPLLIDGLGYLTKFVLSLSGIAAQLQQIAALTAGNIVVKGLSSTGRMLAKYQLVELLKRGTIALPAATQGAIANSAWLGLMKLAPWIIVAGVIVTIVLSESEKKLTHGSDFYLFRQNGDHKGYGFLKYPKLEESQYQAALQALKAYYSDYGDTGSLRAIVLDQDDPVAGYDLTQKDPTGAFLQIADESLAEALWKELSQQFFKPESDGGDWGPFEED